MTTQQHRYGQHYTPGILTEKYKSIFRKVKKQNLTVVDPFVGEGNLLLDYLKLFSKKEAIQLLKSEKVKGFDIDSESLTNIKIKFKSLYKLEDELLDKIFIQNNSLLNNLCEKTDFIITNPPYLSKNICKKKYPKDFDLYFKDNTYVDYYQIALNIYHSHNGVWIIPANFISSEYLASTRRIIMNEKNIDNIYIFENPIFKNTEISVISFSIEDKIKNQRKFNISFINNFSADIISKKIDINKNGFICSEWQKITQPNKDVVLQGLMREDLEPGDIECVLLNEKYIPETFYINEKTFIKLTNNHLFIRTADTGTEKGMLGVYLLEELFPEECKNQKILSLITKDTSRIYAPLFFIETLDKQTQINIKNKVNNTIYEYRKKYNSIFLTNFKNANKLMPRKRISFKEIYGLVEYSLFYS